MTELERLDRLYERTYLAGQGLTIAGAAMCLLGAYLDHWLTQVGFGFVTTSWGVFLWWRLVQRRRERLWEERWAADMAEIRRGLGLPEDS